MSKEVSFSIKIKEDGCIRHVTANAEELGRALRNVQDESEKAKRDILTWSQTAQAFDSLSDAIENLHKISAELTEDYQASVLAQTKLQTIMRQRMGATDEEINSIRTLCAQQQELGVVEDDIAASGAQQLATFLKDKQSLDVLIPAMNNLIAQQEGFHATAEGAVSIGNMMGKAMQGQVEVLQRVGISFDESQKKILQYGNESQRAAMLAEVITANVGHMNEELAKTDSGKQKQLENTLGDIKEKLGSMVEGAMPFVTLAAQATICLAGLVKLVSGASALSAAFSFISIKTVALSLHQKMLATVGRDLGLVIRGVRAFVLTGSASNAVYGRTLLATASASRTAAIATSGLAIALRGLLVATGVGAVVAALTFGLQKLLDALDDTGTAAKDASDSIDTAGESAKSAQEAFVSAQSEMYSRLMTKYTELQTSWRALTSAHAKAQWIKQHAEDFEELGVKIGGVADAEQVFSKNTDAVVQSFVARAKAAARLAQLTEEYRIQMDMADRISRANDAAQARHTGQSHASIFRQAGGAGS